MKPIVKQFNKKAAFTIVELLTVMSIIVVLIGLLVPSLNRVKRYARLVTQKNQFHSINVAMDLFNAEWEGYPDSGALDGLGNPYCGAMKLCEAMMGQDLLGFHPNSLFNSAGVDSFGNLLYPVPPNPPPSPENLRARRKPYLQLESANAYKLKNIYGSGSAGVFNEELFVLCDVYKNVINRETGKRIGMPILYYKADISKVTHDVTNENNPQNIYNYNDDDQLVQLGMPFEDPPPTLVHLMDSTHGTTRYDAPDNVSDAKRFYANTWNEKIKTINRPYRSDSYILLSAGYDGEYGTSDDVFNFEK